MSAQLSVQLGDVLRLDCLHCNPPKLKYYIVLQVEPVFRTFLINSELTEFQAARPVHVEYNPIIRVSANTYLDHDSHIGGDHVSHEHSLESVQRAIARDPSCVLGHVSDCAKDSIRKILSRANPHIAGKHLRELRQQWGL